jgi:proline iminopeptidase
MMRRIPTAIALVGAVYTFIVRPRLLRWGATKEEFEGPYPGEGIIPGGTRGGTMAVTIDAPPREVWPWLVQMGYGRGGWYSWDHLDNWGQSSVHELHPEWQHIAVGDRLPSMPDNKTWWDVAALEEERFLGLRASMDMRGRMYDPATQHPHFYTDSLWGFQLKELPGDRTRLIVSGYWALRPRWLQPIMSFLVLEPSHWVMQTRQFARLQRLAARKKSAEAATAGVDAMLRQRASASGV